MNISVQNFKIVTCPASIYSWINVIGADTKVTSISFVVEDHETNCFYTEENFNIRKIGDLAQIAKRTEGDIFFLSLTLEVSGSITIKVDDDIFISINCADNSTLFRLLKVFMKNEGIYSRDNYNKLINSLEGKFYLVSEGRMEYKGDKYSIDF